MWPIQLAFLLFIAGLLFLSSKILFITSSFLIRSIQLVFSILLRHRIRNLPGISDLLSEVFKSQPHTNLCSNCWTWLGSSWNVSPIWWCISLLVEWLFFHDYSGFNFTCTPWLICYQATQIGEIFHSAIVFNSSLFVLRMFALKFLLPYFLAHTFPFHNILQFQLLYQSCPVAQFVP